MILIRTVFQAKFGKAGELAKEMSASNPEFDSAMNQIAGGPRRWRVLTDLSGEFDTVVFEAESENLAEWERVRTAMFQHPAFHEMMSATQDLIVSGRNEFWTIEAEG